MNLFYKKLIATFKTEKTKDQYRTAGIKPPQFIDLYAGQDVIPEKFEVMSYQVFISAINKFTSN
jgi:hypothetical protein